jgi:hypothetical protein
MIYRVKKGLLMERIVFLMNLQSLFMPYLLLSNKGNFLKILLLVIVHMKLDKVWMELNPMTSLLIF